MRVQLKPLPSTAIKAFPQDLPRPRLFPPSHLARQVVWSLPPHPSFDFGELGSSGASSKFLETREDPEKFKISESDSCSANCQGKCSTPERCAWASIGILPRAWRAPLDPWWCRPASPGAAISRDRDPSYQIMKLMLPNNSRLIRCRSRPHWLWDLPWARSDWMTYDTTQHLTLPSISRTLHKMLRIDGHVVHQIFNTGNWVN
jgi:hypothetical protein